MEDGTKETVIARMGTRIARFIKKSAKDHKLTVSDYLEYLAKQEMGRELSNQGATNDNDGGDIILTREEIQRRLESADDPRNCIAHQTVDEFLKHFDELTISAR
jgi:hypothetical protein